jgi:hypothetical protein
VGSAEWAVVVGGGVDAADVGGAVDVDDPVVVDGVGGG